LALLLLLYVWLLLVLPTNPPQHPQLPGELLRWFFLPVVGLWTQRIWSCHEKNLGLLLLPQLKERKKKKQPPCAPHTYIPELYFSVPACLSACCAQTVL
jgi:hypothetical protein